MLDEIITASLSNSAPKEADHVQHNEQQMQKIEPLKPKAEASAKFEEKTVKIAQEKKVQEKLSKEFHKEEQPQKEQHYEKASQQAATQSRTSDATVKRIYPSFDCAKASMPADIKICASSDLAMLDVKNMRLYKKAKAMDDKATKTIFTDSIKLKFSCGTNISCIAKAYKKSIKSYECVAAGNKTNCVDGVEPKKARAKV